jgi:signal recognition particle GTPase
MRRVILTLAASLLLLSVPFPAIANQITKEAKDTLVAQMEETMLGVTKCVRFCEEMVAELESRVEADQATEPDNKADKALRDQRRKLLTHARKCLEHNRTKEKEIQNLVEKCKQMPVLEE